MFVYPLFLLRYLIMKYTIKDLINKIHTSERTIAIYCETEEEAKLTIRILYDHGISWVVERDDNKDLTFFDQCQNGIVYWIDRNFFKLKITRSSIEYALEEVKKGHLTDLVKAKDIKFSLQNW